MIHSRDKSGNEIIEFCNEYRNLNNIVPLVVVPSAFPHFTENDLHELGVSIIIYANHLLRSAYPAMINAANSILENSVVRSFRSNLKESNLSEVSGSGLHNCFIIFFDSIIVVIVSFF